MPLNKEAKQNELVRLATTPRCREGDTPLSGLFHFTLDPYWVLLDPYLIKLSVTHEASGPVIRTL